MKGRPEGHRRACVCQGGSSRRLWAEGARWGVAFCSPPALQPILQLISSSSLDSLPSTRATFPYMDSPSCRLGLGSHSQGATPPHLQVSPWHTYGQVLVLGFLLPNLSWLPKAHGIRPRPRALVGLPKLRPPYVACPARSLPHLPGAHVSPWFSLSSSSAHHLLVATAVCRVPSPHSPCPPQSPVQTHWHLQGRAGTEAHAPGRKPAY